MLSMVGFATGTVLPSLRHLPPLRSAAGGLCFALVGDALLRKTMPLAPEARHLRLTLAFPALFFFVLCWGRALCFLAS